MVSKLAEGTLTTAFGEYREMLFYDGQKEVIVMLLGAPEDKEDILCRIHSSCIYGHVFNSIECDCRSQMESAQKLMEKEGHGILILMDQEGKGNGHLALMKSQAYKKVGYTQAEAYEAAGYAKDARDFSAAGKILQYLGVKSIRLITDNLLKVNILEKYGVIARKYD